MWELYKYKDQLNSANCSSLHKANFMKPGIETREKLHLHPRHWLILIQSSSVCKEFCLGSKAVVGLGTLILDTKHGVWMTLSPNQVNSSFLVLHKMYSTIPVSSKLSKKHVDQRRKRKSVCQTDIQKQFWQATNIYVKYHCAYRTQYKRWEW